MRVEGSTDCGQQEAALRTPHTEAAYMSAEWERNGSVTGEGSCQQQWLLVIDRHIVQGLGFRLEASELRAKGSPISSRGS